MAARNGRTPERIRHEIELERGELAQAVEQLRAGLDEAKDIGAKLRPKLPVVAAGALGAGFVLAGGIGSVARLVLRKGRQGGSKAKLGRFSRDDRR